MLLDADADEPLCTWWANSPFSDPTLLYWHGGAPEMAARAVPGGNLGDEVDVGVAADGAGNAVFVWGRSSALYFELHQQPMFEDAFETGDTSAWSTTGP